MDENREYVCLECSHPAVVILLEDGRDPYCAPCAILAELELTRKAWRSTAPRKRTWYGRDLGPVWPEPEVSDYLSGGIWLPVHGPRHPWEALRGAARMLEDSGWAARNEAVPCFCPWTGRRWWDGPAELHSAINWAATSSRSLEVKWGERLDHQAGRLLQEWLGLDDYSAVREWEKDPLRTPQEVIAALRSAADLAELQAQKAA